MIGYIEKLGIEYMVKGEGKPMIILHGWGCNKEMFEFVIDEYKHKYKVYSFDLPGFGNSKEPSRVFNTLDYANIMKDALKELNIEKPIAMGHSFGGRVIIKMTTIMSFEKIILLGSAGIVNPKPFSYYLKVYSYKTAKMIYRIPFIKVMFPKLMDKYKNAGSEDYKNASDVMKGVLSTVVNEDLRNEFSFNIAPTLLIWGENDTATPLSDAKLMEKGFKDCGLVVFEKSTHYAFLEQKGRFLKVLEAFI